jgi:hypothetical protein
MESMKTARWKNFLKEEQTRWTALVSDKKSVIREMGKTILAASHVSEEMRFEVGDARVAHLGHSAYLWKWTESSDKGNLVANIWANSSMAWVIEEWGEGTANAKSLNVAQGEFIASAPLFESEIGFS